MHPSSFLKSLALTREIGLAEVDRKIVVLVLEERKQLCQRQRQSEEFLFSLRRRPEPDKMVHFEPLGTLSLGAAGFNSITVYTKVL